MIAFAYNAFVKLTILCLLGYKRKKLYVYGIRIFCLQLLVSFCFTNLLYIFLRRQIIVTNVKINL